MSDIETAMDAPQSADTATDQQPYDLRAALEAEASRQMSEQETGEDIAQEPRDDSRDEFGRFKKKAEEPQEPEQQDAKPKAEGDQPKPEAEQEPLAEEPQANRPPPGWSVSSKATWDELPDSVKADIAKREQEVSDGFKQYQGLKEVIPYQQHYAQQGASVKQALDAYTAVDRALSQDFAGGLSYICQQKNINPVHAALAILQKHGVDPRQLGQGQPQQQNHANPRDPRVDEILQYIQSEKQSRVKSEETAAQTEIEKFASNPEHRYFENVKVTMGHLIQTGQATDLKDAYDKACWAMPEIRSVLIKQQQSQGPGQRQAAANQARQAARSLTGSPAPGGSSADRSKPRSIREIAEDAARQQGVSL